MTAASAFAYSIRAVRAAIRIFGGRIATEYYRFTCREFGRGSRVAWGTWIANPDRVSVGENVFINSGCKIGTEISGATLVIEDNVQINQNVMIDFTGNLSIGNSALISQGVVIYTHTHGLNPRSTASPRSKIIGANAWIGMNAVLLHGCTSVGEQAIVGAGITANEPLPAWSVIGRSADFAISPIRRG